MHIDLSDQLINFYKDNKSFKIGIIGAGKFATMFLVQAFKTKGFIISAIADLDFNRAKQALHSAGAEKELETSSLENALKSNKIWYTDSGIELAKAEQLDLIIEATGNPEAGVDHCLEAFKVKSHVVLVTVEADVLCGAALVKRANEAGVVCSMAYGDQPALICELIERVKTSGFEVVCAGKGTQYLPVYHKSTPETVWNYYGLSVQEAQAGGLNSKMFNSFLDGTKSAIEMASVANATGLNVPEDGLLFPATGTSKLAQDLKPKINGGLLADSGMVEVVSSLNRDGSQIKDDLRYGVFVVFKANSSYVSRCFNEYGVPVDDSGEFAALWRPIHLIGLELGFSVAKVLIDNQSTGATRSFKGDAVAVAKKDLTKGQVLDGEGGKTVWGKLIPANRSIFINALPIGLASKVKLINDVKEGHIISQKDVMLEKSSNAYILRKEMENDFSNESLVE